MDTFDGSASPVYLKRAPRPSEIVDKPDEMSKIAEVYNLSMDIDAQLKERRAWHP